MQKTFQFLVVCKKTSFACGFASIERRTIFDLWQMSYAARSSLRSLRYASQKGYFLLAEKQAVKALQLVQFFYFGFVFFYFCINAVNTFCFIPLLLLWQHFCSCYTTNHLLLYILAIIIFTTCIYVLTDCFTCLQYHICIQIKCLPGWDYQQYYCEVIL